jgi:hypothetical protein
MVIDVELGKEDHNSIPATVIAIGRRLKLFDARTDSQTRLNEW